MSDENQNNEEVVFSEDALKELIRNDDLEGLISLIGEYGGDINEIEVDARPLIFYAVANGGETLVSGLINEGIDCSVYENNCSVGEMMYGEFDDDTVLLAIDEGSSFMPSNIDYFYDKASVEFLENLVDRSCVSNEEVFINLLFATNNEEDMLRFLEGCSMRDLYSLGNEFDVNVYEKVIEGNYTDLFKNLLRNDYPTYTNDGYSMLEDIYGSHSFLRPFVENASNDERYKLFEYVLMRDDGYYNSSAMEVLTEYLSAEELFSNVYEEALRDFEMKLINNDTYGEVIRFVDIDTFNSILDDVLEICNRDGKDFTDALVTMMEKASDEIKNDKETIIKLINQNIYLIRHAGEELHTDKEFLYLPEVKDFLDNEDDEYLTTSNFFENMKAGLELYRREDA